MRTTFAILPLLFALCSQAAYVTPVGIPNPTNWFGGRDPLNDVAPAHPANWPSAEAEGYYYIWPQGPNADDTGNTYGYPDKPRVTIPAGPFAAGSYIELRGDIALPLERIFNGTSESPIWFRGDGTNNPVMIGNEFVLKGYWTTIENIYSSGSLNARIRNGTGGVTNFTVRNCTLYRTNFMTGTVGNAIGVSAAGSTNVVFYNNSVNGFGDYASDVQSDPEGHAFGVGTGSKNVWVLNNTATLCGGDGVQIGDTEATRPTWAQNVYVGDNTFYFNGENAVDIKRSENVVISKNRGYGYDGHKASAPGEAVIIHNQPTNVWLLNNLFYESMIGVSSTGDFGGWYVGNIIYGCSNGLGDFRGGAIARVYNNTVYGAADYGLYGTGPDVMNCLNNLVVDCTASLALTDATGRSASVVSNECYWNTGLPISISWGADYSSVAGFISGTSVGDNSISADPLFVGANDFRLSSTNSPCWNAGVNYLAAMESEFATVFGFALNYRDRAGNARGSDGAVDIGAYEYAPSGSGQVGRVNVNRLIF